MRVLLPDQPPFRALHLPGLEVAYVSADHLPDGPADGLVLWGLPREARRTLLTRGGLKWVLTLTAGVDHLLPDLPEGVALYNAHTLHDDAVAQHAAALLLSAGRGLSRFRDAQREGHWGLSGSLHTLRGREVVIWGYGHIGRLLEGMLQPFGARVSGLTSRSSDEEVRAALGKADDLVLLLPGTPATRHILNAQRLEQLKPGAWVLNLGRGELIDPDALLSAVQAGQVAGAALDVTEPEPLPQDHPLWGLEQVIITPHIASTTDDLPQRGADYATTFLREMQQGGAPEGRVPTGRGY
ncbi:D-2-hydroxyacid dehydrogenase [Deinococcus sonorensis]|uniref:D-2-hydroxyacid dehydrogenase n=2 Tax=Deinococcus sonorensis TaxID=309891 RepID=A0AAU7UAB0_9DEIO